MKKFLITLCLVICNICNAAEPPITIVVPFAAGGSGDIVARIIQQGLIKETGRAVTLIYKPGPGGIMGMNYILEQKSAGPMLLLHSDSFFISHILNKSPTNLSEDFKLVSSLGYHPFVLVANSQFQYKDVTQWKKLKGKTISIGNGGPGSTSLVANTLFAQNFSNSEFIHVSYGKGGGPMALDVAAGVLNISLLPIGLAKQLSTTGKIQALAVANKNRLADLPDIPTLHELGVKGDTIHTSYLLLGTKAMSEGDTLYMRAVLDRVLKDHATQSQYTSNGLELGQPPASPDDFIATELVKYEKWLKKLK